MAWHILAANRNVWMGNKYDLFTFIHLPVSPLWISMVHHIGIPLRTAVELAFLASCLYFIYALRAIAISRIVCTICFTMAVFNPWTFRLFNLTLAEIPYTFLLLAAVSASVLALVHRNDSGYLLHLFLLGLWCTLLWNLRKENILIALYIVILSLICMLLMRIQKISWKNVLHKQIILFLVPLLMVTVLTSTFMALNYWKWGLFAMTELTSPGYKAAYKSLLRIRPSKPVHYVSVTSEVRHAAYGVSPAFNELRLYLETPFNNFAEETKQVLGIQNEIASGWFYWALRDAAAASGHLTSAREGNDFFQQIANEINKAIEEGRLEERFAPFTFLDPDILTYRSKIPGSFLKLMYQFRERQELPAMTDDATPELMQVYNRIANRKTVIPDRYAERLQHQIWKVHGTIIDCLVFLAIGAVAILITRRKVILWQEPGFAIVALIGFIVFSRIGLFSLLDASSWPANQPRYLLPVMPLFSCFLVLLINQAWISRQLLPSNKKPSTKHCAD